MPVYKWTAEYSVRIVALDEEHRRLLDAVQQMLTLVNEGQAGAARRCLEDFFKLSLKHFQTEERLLAETGYPGLAKQSRDHAEFGKRLEALIRKTTPEPSLLTASVVEGLGQWYIAHMTGADRAYSEYLLDYGIK